MNSKGKRLKEAVERIKNNGGKYLPFEFYAAKQRQSEMIARQQLHHQNESKKQNYSK